MRKNKNAGTGTVRIMMPTDNAEDHSQDAAGIHVRFIGVLDARRLHFLPGFAAQVPGNRGEDRDEDTDNAEDQDQRSLRVLPLR